MKVKLTLSISREIVDEAKRQKINISYTVEQFLRQLLDGKIKINFSRKETQ
jgi:hypothetical protein